MRFRDAVRCAAVLVALLSARLAAADQAAYISKSDAERAAALINDQMEIRHFCAPCGDTTWRSEIVESKSVAPAGYEDYYELKINGTGVDLAYVYIPEKGRWANLAMRAGVEVSDVPEFLATKTSGGGPDFQRNLYKGLIDGRLAFYMSLEKAEDTLSGHYAYTSKGLPISLEGTVDVKGAFTLSEFVDGEKTGVFVGQLSPKSERLESTWATPDGKKRLPFVADRFAELAEEDITVTFKGWTIEGHLGYPQFTMKDAKAADRVTRAIREALRAAYEEFERDTRELLADREPPGEGMDPSCYFDTSDYDVAFFSDSLVSVVFIIYSYPGGAHPNSYYRVFNYRLGGDPKPQPVELAELFKDSDSHVAALSAKLIPELKKQEAEWVVNGQITEFAAEEISTFAITPRGLDFLFSPYAVGPYVQGAFSVEIAYDALGDILKRDGALAPVFEKAE